MRTPGWRQRRPRRRVRVASCGLGTPAAPPVRTAPRLISYGCAQYSNRTSGRRRSRSAMPSGFRAELALFHVELTEWRIQFGDGRRLLGAGDEELGSRIQEPSQDPTLVLAVEFGGK